MTAVNGTNVQDSALSSNRVLQRSTLISIFANDTMSHSDRKANKRWIEIRNSWRCRMHWSKIFGDVIYLQGWTQLKYLLKCDTDDGSVKIPVLIYHGTKKSIVSANLNLVKCTWCSIELNTDGNAIDEWEGASDLPDNLGSFFKWCM